MMEIMVIGTSNPGRPKEVTERNDLEQTLQMMLVRSRWSKCNDGRM